MRDSTISHYVMPIVSRNKIVNEHLEDVSISTEITEAMTKNSSIGDNLEDVISSDLEI